jgi:ADP-ribosylglycohydrolase/catechol 2,3-dioxygenase-like lactoylglutathione lyase family enzyme
VAELADFESRAEAAMLAAAVGDALGWPQENRGGRVGGRRGVEPQLDFVEWRRRGGGRYASHEEVIGAGEYSDDTQLIAAVGRSLLIGKGWWDRWTRLELPFWLLYERGGGGATKRACQAWTKGNAPWTDEARERYFAAGGNGVAMRVLPHCLRDDDFARVAESIVADGIATHGHPRAHVGALAYGYALWRALRRRERLPYGALIEETREEVATWSRCPPVDNVAPDWAEAANTAGPGLYDDLWKKTVSEMMDLLSLCGEAIGQGALSVDRETLQKLGAFDKRVSSAGTITAAGALFLASRYASRAEQGLLSAAFAHGADTDTLASMTGSLLAAINGGDWLGKARERVQDDRFLVRLARSLVVGTIREDRASSDPDVRTLVRRLDGTEVGMELTLPDGRIGHLRNVADHPTKTRNEIKTFVVETDDGQTLFFKRARKLQGQPPSTGATQAQRPRGRIAVALQVDDLERSIGFWRDIAQLEVVAVTQQYVSVDGYIALFPTAELGPTKNLKFEFASDGELRHARRWILVFVERRELNEIRKRLNRAAVPSVSVAGARGEWHGVRCADPDGNVVEFRERNGIP